jgi:pimeloyl-[acyl-carrier protein] synthase
VRGGTSPIAGMGQTPESTGTCPLCDDAAVAQFDELGEVGALRALRRADPVHWSDELGVWVFTRYDDIAAALRDPRWRRTPPAGVENPGWPADYPAIGSVMDHLFLTMDPPDHTRLRGLVNRAFTPVAVAAMEARIRAIVDELLDGLARRSSFDVIADFAVPLPATVIAELLGIPTTDLARFKRWSDDFAVVIDYQPDVEWSALEVSMAGFSTYVRELANERRADPRADLISALVARHEGDALTEDELVATVILLIAAGHETTTNLIGNGVLTFFRHPDQLARFRDDPAVAATAVDEILRFESPVQTTFRIAGEAIDVEGRRILPGQEVMLSLAAGNRDPAAFPSPDAFDVGRSPNRHLAFGLGAHFCIGAPLARMEGRIALTSLFDRFPGLRPAARSALPAWRTGLIFRALEELSVEA